MFIFCGVSWRGLTNDGNKMRCTFQRCFASKNRRSLLLQVLTSVSLPFIRWNLSGRSLDSFFFRERSSKTSCIIFHHSFVFSFALRHRNESKQHENELIFVVETKEKPRHSRNETKSTANESCEASQ